MKAHDGRPEIIEHFGGFGEIRRSIEEIYRVLRPGGVAALATMWALRPQPPQPGQPPQPDSADVNGAEQEGAGPYQWNVRRGMRALAAAGGYNERNAYALAQGKLYFSFGDTSDIDANDPLTMAFALVYYAEHYVIDILAGFDVDDIVVGVDDRRR